jgi:sulfite reductase (NADPH) hemoprotein beta-component
MYQYDEYDQKAVDERVEQYREQTRRFLNGELTDEEFRHLRLRNGLYIQTHAPMLRVAIPYGTLNSKQVHMLAHIAREYDKGYGHISTRQNIQYNWPELERVPDILADLASVQMHAIQTSGNCIRNTTTDHLAGVAADELEDPRPYCEIVRQWSTFHPEFNWLPRKFKIAFSGATYDRAAVQLHDIGVYLVENAEGKIGFRIIVGGGMGRMPIIGVEIREYLEKEDLLSYLEAILRIYNLEGRRDNMQRARIKVLVKSMGIDAFREKVDAEWERIKTSSLKLDQKEIDRIKTYFVEPEFNKHAAADQSIVDQLNSNAAFQQWYKQNTVEHKVAGYRAVYISLKAPGVPPGDVTDTQLDLIADLGEKFSFDELRTTHDQNMVLPHVEQADLYALWETLNKHELATANIGTLNDMICCPGLDFCSLANASSISIAKQINDKFDNLDYLYDLGEIKVKMSGCMNACGHHHVGHIGILGVDKKGVEFYQFTLGGSADNQASLGDRLGPAIGKEEVADAIDKILSTYLEEREGDEETFINTYRRVGIEPFKENVYSSTGAE